MNVQRINRINTLYTPQFCSQQVAKPNMAQGIDTFERSDSTSKTFMDKLKGLFKTKTEDNLLTTFKKYDFRIDNIDYEHKADSEKVITQNKIKVFEALIKRYSRYKDSFETRVEILKQLDNVNAYNANLICNLIKDGDDYEYVFDVNDTKQDINAKEKVYQICKKNIEEPHVIPQILEYVNEKNVNSAEDYCKHYDIHTLCGKRISDYLKNDIDSKKLKQLKDKMGNDFYDLSVLECKEGAKLLDLFDKESIKDLDLETRILLLDRILKSENEYMSDLIRHKIPLLYKYEEYSKLIPKLAKSITVEIVGEKKVEVKNPQMKRLSENPKFKELDESDKKVLMLGAMLCDKNNRAKSLVIPKDDEKVIKMAIEYNLNNLEKQKLHTLYKTQNWVEVLDKTIYKKDDLKSFAYDFRFGNLSDLAIILAESANVDPSKYQESIKKEICAFAKTQPLLPQTKLPKTTKIKDAITVVKEDGSTNIKGVYQTKKGMVILNYNEIEDWEQIGFAKSSKSRGITAKDSEGNEINTGNIKFLVHGLDNELDLVNFDIFNLLDSDALLSVSYTEIPESKNRFFRPQGVILDVDTHNIHGGGATDSGSGCIKNITNFKNDNIYTRSSGKDREYISDLIKKNASFSDDEYIRFVEKNKNKSYTAIEPIYQEKLIGAFVQMKSRKRRFAREYNEMFVSSPNVTGVFVYPEIEKANSGLTPVQYIQNNPKKFGFLEEYAIEHDIPMVFFGKL